MDISWLDSILDWIKLHPQWAGVTICIIAFLESLALVGIMMPGAIILFGFGALVGIGALPLYPTLIWCSLGAVLGDGLSFWLGHHYLNHLRTLWPFRNYLKLLGHGEKFIKQHGRKSIFIGRFIGPVRPIIPVTAGMLGMPIRQYLPVNIVASTLWSPFYILPGVAIGYSLDLIAAVAGRLALVLGLLIALIWGSWWLVYRIYSYCAPRTSKNLERALAWCHRHPTLGKFTQPLIDPLKPESGSLALLASLLIVTSWGFSTLALSTPFLDFDQGINHQVYALFNKLRSPWADQLMAFITALGEPLVLYSISSIGLIFLFWRRQFLAAWHWLAALGFGLVLSKALGWGLPMPLPPDSLRVDGFSYPATSITLSVVVYGFFAVITARQFRRYKQSWAYAIAVLILSLISFSRLYFGAYWLSDVLISLTFGWLWVAFLGIAYRHHSRRSFWIKPLAIVFYGSLLMASLVQNYYGTDEIIKRYALPEHSKSIEFKAWWTQGLIQSSDDQVLNAKQHPINLQYSGPIDAIETALSNAGWQAADTLDWRNMLRTLLPSQELDQQPILPRAFRGRHEALIFVNMQSSSIIRLWPSDSHIITDEQPVWLGMLSKQQPKQILYFFSVITDQKLDIANSATLLNQLEGFRWKTIDKQSTTFLLLKTTDR